MKYYSPKHMDWFIERLGQTSPTLDYHDLTDHADDFKKLADLKIIKYSQQLDTIACDLCDEDHLVTPFLNAKGELVISCNGSRRVVKPDELKIWTINSGILAKNVNSKDHVIGKKQFEQTAFAATIEKINLNSIYVPTSKSKPKIRRKQRRAG